MQRALRIGWVVPVNAAVVWFTISRLSPEFSTFSLWTIPLGLELVAEVSLEVLLPIAGAIAEIANWKYSQRLNVGYLALATCWWIGESITWRSNPYFGVILLVAASFLVLTGVTCVLYRATEID
jgi:hypothetical protein